MNENIKKFLKKIEADQELQKKLAVIRDPEEAYQLAASVQEGFTKEEFVTEMKKLYAEATKDLSEDDLVKLAGGAPTADTEYVLISATVSAVSGAATIAATVAASSAGGAAV